MALTEVEELELLELENENTKAKASVPRETPKESYLGNLAKPVVELEQKLHERGTELANTPLAAKPAKYINEVAGGLGDVITAGAKTAWSALPQGARTGISETLGKTPLSELAKSGLGAISNIAQPAVSKFSEFKQKHPVLGEYAEAGGNIAIGGIPGVKGAEEVLGPIARKTGEGLESLGKKALAGDMKITKAVAKKAYGETIDEQKQNIIDDIVKYKLHDPLGNYSKMAEKANQKAIDNFGKADEIIQRMAKNENVPKINPTDAMLGSIDNVAIPAGSENLANNTINKIMQDFEAKGFNKPETIDKLVEAKRYLNADGRIFDNGPMATDADNLNRAIRKNMYLALTDVIGTMSPEVKQLNQNAKRLIDISNASTEAAARTTNHSLLGLGGLAAGAGGMAYGGAPEAIASALLTTAALKSAGQGRGAATLIKAGEGLQALGNLKPAEKIIGGIGEDIGKISEISKKRHGNERGAGGTAIERAIAARRGKEKRK